MTQHHQCLMHQPGKPLQLLLRWQQRRTELLLSLPSPAPVLSTRPAPLHSGWLQLLLPVFRCCCCCLLLVCLDCAGTAQATSAAGSNETDLLARGGPAADSGSVTNVLVVTTTVGMLHGVHAHTTHLHTHNHTNTQQ